MTQAYLEHNCYNGKLVTMVKQEHTADVSGERTSVVSENPLLLRTPVPDHDRAVLGAGHHIAVLTDIALRPSNARHHVVMAEYCLHHITCQQHMLVGWSLTSLFNTNTVRLYQRKKVRDGELSSYPVNKS